VHPIVIGSSPSARTGSGLAGPACGVPCVKRVENCITDSITGGTIAVLAVTVACVVAMVLTAVAVCATAAAGIGVVLLLSSWMGMKTPALPAFVVVLFMYALAAGVIVLAAAWLMRAPLRRAIERALVRMGPR
jgi:hypothetical protein